MFDLSGKRAFVGGASQGIGRACAEALAAAGAEVTIAARSEPLLAEVCAGLSRTRGQRHGFVRLDYGDPDAVRRAASELLRGSGPIDILVNNTGGPPAGALQDADVDELTRAFAQHVLCCQVLAQTFAPAMRQRGFGRIVNIISTSVVVPIRGLGVSNTVRAAVANWARTLAAELAPFGITVNNVLPGYTDTARLRVLLRRRAEQSGMAFEEVERQAQASTPAGRFARPEEIAAAVVFLASPAASYVNGVNLPVDGGRLAVQ